MQTIEITNPTEARRCRYAQYRGEKARLMLNGLPITKAKRSSEECFSKSSTGQKIRRRCPLSDEPVGRRSVRLAPQVHGGLVLGIFAPPPDIFARMLVNKAEDKCSAARSSRSEF